MFFVLFYFGFYYFYSLSTKNEVSIILYKIELYIQFIIKYIYSFCPISGHKTFSTSMYDVSTLTYIKLFAELHHDWFSSSIVKG